MGLSNRERYYTSSIINPADYCIPFNIYRDAILQSLVYYTLLGSFGSWPFSPISQRKLTDGDKQNTGNRATSYSGLELKDDDGNIVIWRDLIQHQIQIKDQLMTAENAMGTGQKSCAQHLHTVTADGRDLV